MKPVYSPLPLARAAIAALVIIGMPSSGQAGPERAHNPANTISTEADHPDSFRHFAPELPMMKARVPAVNTEFGLMSARSSPDSSSSPTSSTNRHSL